LHNKNSVKCTMFAHHNIHKYIYIYDGKRHEISHVSTHKRRHSSVVGVRSLRGAGCDNDHYLVVAKVGEAVSKQAVQKFYMTRFD
jgi:hypothetical protein